VVSNLAGNQITNFLKQYSEYGLPFPVAASASTPWSPGARVRGNFSGIWPLVWHHLVDTPSSKNTSTRSEEVWQASGQSVQGRLQLAQIVAQSMNGTVVTRRARGHLRKGAKFGMMKAREVYFRPYDNQMVMKCTRCAPGPSKMKDNGHL
jgi:branched-chain amino acid transport system substrate-binding protein